MSKNVLIISASPRKGGNSDLLCDRFLAGAREAGHQAEKIFLRDKKINYCLGCGVCNSTHACVQKDDMAPLLDKMVAADVIVFATPVYFYSCDGQLKTFIDRCVPRYTEMKDKEFLEGAREKGVIYGTGAWQAGEVKDLPVYQEAYEAGKNC